MTLADAGARSANAQGIFCPTTIPGATPGISLVAGHCTNGPQATGTGAFSNAALASEALTDLAQSTTQVTNTTLTNALATRRQVEQDRCPEGQERVDGVCRPIASVEPVSVLTPPPATAPASAAPPSTSAAPSQPTRRIAPRVATRPAPPVYKAPPPPVIAPVRFASWIEGLGDFEHRTGASETTVRGNTLFLNGDSRATMGGVLGGADATFRGVWFANDLFIVGALTGYLSSNVRLTTTSTSGAPANIGNGASTLSAHLDGPSLGGYVTYLNGPFSADLTFRADFLSLSESFYDTLAFTGISVPATVTGSGSTQLVNYTTTGNLNYRIPATTSSWIEPTVGFGYTHSDYDSSAAVLGLSNGELVKVQGGVRFGTEMVWGNAKLTTSLTGLAYEDVSVTGGFIQNVAFGSNALIVNDQGLLRGQGILAFNLAYNNGVSLFAQADVRGGKDLFGAGGRGGVRIQW